MIKIKSPSDVQVVNTGQLATVIKIRSKRIYLIDSSKTGRTQWVNRDQIKPVTFRKMHLRKRKGWLQKGILLLLERRANVSPLEPHMTSKELQRYLATSVNNVAQALAVLKQKGKVADDGFATTSRNKRFRRTNQIMDEYVNQSNSPDSPTLASSELKSWSGKGS